jgi:brefeldin A-inhibited guanine nucleotide-exchange protein
MLNTDIHDPRLKSGSSGRKAMTEDQFISNLYRNVAANPIEWKADKDALAREEAGNNSNNNSNSQEAKLEAEKQFRKDYELLARKSQAYLKNEAAIQRNFMKTNNVHVVAGLFEVTWYRFVAAITNLMEHTKDTDVLQVCLDGLSYGSTIAVLFGWETERNSFASVLAKFVFSQANSNSKNDTDLQRRIVQGEHLQQEWYQQLQKSEDPIQSCKSVIKVVHEAKEKLT